MLPYRCPICNGSGLVSLVKGLDFGKVTCLTCQGTGIVWGE